MAENDAVGGEMGLCPGDIIRNGEGFVGGGGEAGDAEHVDGDSLLFEEGEGLVPRGGRVSPAVDDVEVAH